MKRQGPYAAVPQADPKGNPLPGLPPRSRRPNPQRGPGLIERVKQARSREDAKRLLDNARSYEHISHATLRKAKALLP